MNPRLIPVVALTCAAMFGLAGCGQATGPTAAPDADPTSAATSSDAAAGGGGVSGSSGSPGSTFADPSQAQWPTIGCDSRSVVSVDHGRMPTGFASPQEAVENSPAVGLPEGVLVMAPDSDKGPAQVWVVDPATDEIQAQVSVYRGPDGWFVDGVMTCG